MFILYIIMIILMIYFIDDAQGGCTALHWAVGYGRYDCAQLLIQAGADVDIQDNVSKLYMLILYIIMIMIMIYLIDDTQLGGTVLHGAVTNGHYDCAQLLIQSGTDVDIKNIVSTLYVHTVYHHDHIYDISY